MVTKNINSTVPLSSLVKNKQNNKKKKPTNAEPAAFIDVTP
jgi:hypothetical protein